tara:strand:+ start:1729 stop:1998 length:270 start_codon:yes stop_codon:yes gene_type:complete
MTYEDWINRPVYRAQVTTARMLRYMLNLDVMAALATSPEHPIALLRLLPQYRCARSRAIRKALADRVRALRLARGRRNVIIKRIHAWKD